MKKAESRFAMLLVCLVTLVACGANGSDPADISKADEKSSGLDTIQGLDTGPGVDAPAGSDTAQAPDTWECTLNEYACSYLACAEKFVWGESCCALQNGKWVWKDEPCSMGDCSCPAGFSGAYADATPPFAWLSCLIPLGQVCTSQVIGTCTPSIVELPSPDCPPEAPFKCRWVDLDDPFTSRCTDCPCVAFEPYTEDCGTTGPIPGSFCTPDCEGYGNVCMEMGWEQQEMCATQCVEECPCGLECRIVQEGPDVLFGCTNPFTRLCYECETDDDCLVAGELDVGGRCMEWPMGKRCSVSCEDRDCPGQFTCDENLDPPQCIPDPDTPCPPVW